ncbi:MAG TPA: helix-turn-helix domain-containing protein [Candidatus Eisenbacteria bacterium]|nr:helix-turn-helix domain-containing protein [Candidatus Eisenbacteria bacterium]
MKRKIPVARILEDIIACKWSLSVLAEVRKGVCRPGALRREIEGISTKVLNQRLSKMVRYGILHKEIFAEIPPRVEYRLTDLGVKLIGILDQVEALQREIDRQSRLASVPGQGRRIIARIPAHGRQRRSAS